MKTLLLIIAFVLFIFALIVANGGDILSTAWNVWLCGGLAAMALHSVVNDRLN